MVGFERDQAIANNHKGEFLGRQVIELDDPVILHCVQRISETKVLKQNLEAIPFSSMFQSTKVPNRIV